MNSFEIYSPTKTIFGAGQISNLHNQKIPGKKALIVISDGQTANVSGGMDKLRKELELVGVEYGIFNGIHQNPTNKMIDAGVRAARECNADFIIGLGGGSVLDASKAISLMFYQEKNDYWYYFDHPDELEPRWLPVITVTTDAGTGSESDPYMCIANGDIHIKSGYPGTKILGTFPVIAIVDPELMTTVPEDFTAYQGFDTFFHALEGYINNKHNIMSDMYAERSIEMLCKYLPIAYNEPDNLEAREQVAFANNLAGIVIFVSYTCSQHAIEHGIGAFHLDLPHGAGILAFTKEWCKWYIEHHGCDDRFIRLAQIMGKKDATDPMDFMEALEDLMKAVNVNDVKLSDYGITRDELPVFVEKAFDTQGPGFANDIVEMNREDVLGILERSYK